MDNWDSALAAGNWGFGPVVGNWDSEYRLVAHWEAVPVVRAVCTLHPVAAIALADSVVAVQEGFVVVAVIVETADIDKASFGKVQADFESCQV